MDVWIIGACALLIAACLVLYGKELLYTIFDAEGAAVSGLPTTFLYFLLITMTTLSVVMSIKVVGIVLVSAMLVTPAAAAAQLARSFGRILVAAALIGWLCTTGGLLLSFWWDTASGATIVLLLTLAFALAALWRLLRRGGEG
jgi:zinc transport system permease protein